ncbi:CBS domain-containing protein [Neptuniibacter sp. CAU 1671]|uniref:CBS domain-containing protein n=1 Tax=Neptuniibacter sp. CAU 1671 TaxID=3032593 RepID=UPI0023DAABE6|nr:CBS domain-containing protein [Neptuniibacter sp. CAU 1671]MDF2182139.1 CBS domain-containing protein [Neptuniibacter sp. CAU 1671]
MLRSVKAQDYMTRDLVTFKPDTDLFQAINMLLEYRISGAPVVDDEGCLVGLISEGDCLKAILTLTYHEEEMGGVVGTYMTPQVHTIPHDADIIRVANEFIQHNRRRLPVVKEGRLIGQISRRDVLRAVEKFAQNSKT